MALKEINLDKKLRFPTLNNLKQAIKPNNIITCSSDSNSKG